MYVASVTEVGTMIGRKRSSAWRWMAIGALALVLALAMSSAAFAVAPTQPRTFDAYPIGGDQIKLIWTSSTDATVGHTISYEVYRAKVPITQAMIDASSPLLTTVTPASLTSAEPTWTAVINADVAGGEVLDTYVWYYAVRAKDNTNLYSLVSKTLAPNMHGNRMDISVISCDRCHSAHGAPTTPLGALDVSMNLCYYCHGHSDGTTTGVGDKSTLNTKADFYDYSTQTFGSQHRSTDMTTDGKQCKACHTPHRAPYYWNSTDGVTASLTAASSFRKMLRVQSGVSAGKPTYTYYNVYTDTAENISFCYSCHGATTGATNMGYVSSTGWATTAGDHYEAGYASAAAHGTGVLYSNDKGATRETDLPQIQCLACHDKHASKAKKLIAYRGADTNGAATYAQAELCFACHSAASTESKVVTGNTAPFSWNSRDVKAEFSRTSHHPTSIQTGVASALSATWAQTTDTDFGTDTLAGTAVSGTGAAAVVQLSGTTGNYTNMGSVVSQIIVPPGGGTLDKWGALTLNGTAPAGSTLLFDVLDSSGMPIAGFENLTLADSGKSLAAIANSAIKLRARLQGNGGTPPSISDDFTHPSFAAANFDTTKWTDAFIGGMVDPDAGGAVNALFDNFTDGNYTANPTWTVVSPDWSIANTNWAGNATNFVQGGNGFTTTTRLDTGTLWDGTASGSTPSGWTATAGTTAFTASNSTTTWPSGTGWTTMYVRSGNANGTSYTLESPAFTAVAGGAELSFTWRKTDAQPIYMDARVGAGAWQQVWSDTTAGAAGSGTTPVTVGLNSGTTQIRLRYDSAGGRGAFDNVYVYNDDVLQSPVLNLAGATGVTVKADSAFIALDAGEWMYTELSTDNGATWTVIRSAQGTGGNVTDMGWSYAIPDGNLTSQMYVRLRVRGADSGEYGCWDNIAVGYTAPATNLWPSEAGTVLELKSEGSGFTGAADVGEFAYINSPSPTDWISANNFDLETQVTAGGTGAAKAGLMIRRGADVPGAVANGASMAGLYVNNGNIVFQWRNAAGGNTTTASTSTGAGTTPIWLRLERRGLVITAKYSTDHATWTTIGTTVTFGATASKWLVGVANTSSASTTPPTWAQASYDNFSVTDASPITSTVTPQLADWSLAYTYYAAATGGEVTCANCHNVHSVTKGTAGATWDLFRVSDPDNTKLAYTGSVGGYCLRCHDGVAHNQIADANTLVPYSIKFTTFSAATSPFFFGNGLWNKSATGAVWTGSAHDNASAIGKDCGTCHDPHSSDFPRLTAYTGGTYSRANTTVSVSKEEGLCYAESTCHSSAAGTRNVQTPMSATYSHTTENVANAHLDTEGATALGSANRHSECADCHDPHAAKAGIHASPGTNKVGSSNPGNALLGAGGIKPTYPIPAFTGGAQVWATVNKASAWAPERMNGEATDLEAYVCLKCHSTYSDSGLPHSVTNGSRTYTATDVALEFNPSNFAVHNVLGQSVGVQTAFTYIASNGTSYTNTWTFPTTNVFKGNYGANTMLTCTSCHSNETASAARGPHGSSAKWIIDPAYGRDWRTIGLGSQGAEGMVYMNGSTATAASDVICAKCHDLYDGTNWAHEGHSRSDHWLNGGDNCRCVDCHIAIPHGWKTPRLLMSGAVNSAYLAPMAGRTNPASGAPYTVRIRANSNYTPSTWQKDDCGAQGACSTHSAATIFWP